MEANSIRIFIAIELPDAVKRHCISIIEMLKSAGADVGWLKPAGMHLTIKFLGQTQKRLTSRISEELSIVADKQAPIDFRVGNLGVFPNAQRPRVIWSGCHDTSSTLGEFAKKIDEAMSNLGFKREKRIFNPHLTLGRVRSGRNVKQLTSCLDQNKHVMGPEFTASEIILFESVLKASGAEYIELAKQKLMSDLPQV